MGYDFVQPAGENHDIQEKIWNRYEGGQSDRLVESAQEENSERG